MLGMCVSLIVDDKDESENKINGCVDVVCVYTGACAQMLRSRLRRTRMINTYTCTQISLYIESMLTVL